MADILGDQTYRGELGIIIFIDSNGILIPEYQGHRSQVHAVNADFIHQVYVRIKSFRGHIFQLEFIDHDLRNVQNEFCGVRRHSNFLLSTPYFKKTAADRFVPAGHPEPVGTRVPLFGRDGYRQPVGGADHAFKPDPADLAQRQCLPACSADQVMYDGNLGDSWENRFLREMSVKPG